MRQGFCFRPEVKFQFAECLRWQREPDWPADIDTPLGSPGSFLQYRNINFSLSIC